MLILAQIRYIILSFIQFHLEFIGNYFIALSFLSVGYRVHHNGFECQNFYDAQVENLEGINITEHPGEQQV